MDTIKSKGLSVCGSILRTLSLINTLFPYFPSLVFSPSRKPSITSLLQTLSSSPSFFISIHPYESLTGCQDSKEFPTIPMVLSFNGQPPQGVETP